MQRRPTWFLDGARRTPSLPYQGVGPPLTPVLQLGPRDVVARANVTALGIVVESVGVRGAGERLPARAAPPVGGRTAARRKHARAA